MAEKRMFAKGIIDSDSFLDMPASAQNLYFHLGMRADDEGFINNYKRIMRDVRASEDDFRVLAAKKYVICFDSGIVVITHWRIHNYIQSDRFHPTTCVDEKAQLVIESDKSYRKAENTLFDVMDTTCIQNDSIPLPEIRLDKTRLDEIRLDKTSTAKSGFVPPTIEEIKEYAQMIGCTLDAEYFFDTYQSTGWMINGNPISDWKAVVRKWKKNPKNYQTSKPTEKRADYTGSWDNPEGDTF